jgi:hypothetical protein
MAQHDENDADSARSLLCIMLIPEEVWNPSLPYRAAIDGINIGSAGRQRVRIVTDPWLP